MKKLKNKRKKAIFAGVSSLGLLGLVKYASTRDIKAKRALGIVPFAEDETYVFKNIVFETEKEADEALGLLANCMDEFGHFSVSDLYNVAGVTGVYRDSYMGWFNREDLDILKLDHGYILTLKEPVEL